MSPVVAELDPRAGSGESGPDPALDAAPDAAEAPEQRGGA
jgi:hypothetical protein